MAAIVGDRVAVQAKSVHSPERIGTVQAVLAESPLRYQVRWDAGEWSIITAGALRIVPPARKPPPRRQTTTPKRD